MIDSPRCFPNPKAAKAEVQVFWPEEGTQRPIQFEFLKTQLLAATDMKPWDVGQVKYRVHRMFHQTLFVVFGSMKTRPVRIDFTSCGSVAQRKHGPVLFQPTLLYNVGPGEGQDTLACIKPTMLRTYYIILPTYWEYTPNFSSKNPGKAYSIMLTFFYHLLSWHYISNLSALEAHNPGASASPSPQHLSLEEHPSLQGRPWKSQRLQRPNGINTESTPWWLSML